MHVKSVRPVVEVPVIVRSAPLTKIFVEARVRLPVASCLKIRKYKPPDFRLLSVVEVTLPVSVSCCEFPLSKLIVAAPVIFAVA